MGGMNFILHARVVLTPEGEELVKKYKSYKEFLYRKGDGIPIKSIAF